MRSPRLPRGARSLLALAVLLAAACTPAADDPPAGAPADDQAPAAAATPVAAARSRSPRGARPRRQPTVEVAGARAAPAPDVAGLADTLTTALDNLAGTYGYVVEDLTYGQRLAYNPDHVFPSASVYKLAVAVEVLRRVDRGDLALDQTVEVGTEDALEDEPDDGLAPGDTPTLSETLRAMLHVSSNTAGHALLRTLGRASLNAELDGLGLKDTSVPLLSSDGPDPDGQPGPSMAVTTPDDMAHLLRLVESGALLREPSRALLYDLLAYREDFDGLAGGLPDEVPVLSKSGNLEDASNVAGLVRTPRGTVVVTVFDEGADVGEARTFMAQLGNAILERHTAAR